MAPWLVMGGLGLAKGLMDSGAQRKAEKRNMMANATAIEMSPWTGMNPGMMQGSASNPLGAALGGAVQGGTMGAMFGQQFGGGKEGADTLFQKALAEDEMKKKLASGIGSANQLDYASLLSRTS